MTITAAIDGSSLGNPGPTGWAWVINQDHWRSGGFPTGTNNIGELTALIELLKATPADEPLAVLADSQYVINSATTWIPGWKKRGWRRADGKPIKNRDLMEQIDQLLQGREVEFYWVKGHAGHPLNEAADARACEAAAAFQTTKPPVAEDQALTSTILPTTRQVREAWCSRFDGEHVGADADEKLEYQTQFDAWLRHIQAAAWEGGYNAKQMDADLGFLIDGPIRTPNPYQPETE